MKRSTIMITTGILFIAVSIAVIIIASVLGDEVIPMLAVASAFLFTGVIITFSGIDEKDVDLVVLYLPTPWDAIKSAEKALRTGGYLVCYNPQITQTADFVNAISKNDKFLYEKTIELIERNWTIQGKITRPKSEGIGHTAFLTFVRKV